VNTKVAVHDQTPKKPVSASKPKLTPGGDALLRPFGFAQSACFLDGQRVVAALVGKVADDHGGVRCSIISLANGEETVIDPRLYAQNGRLAVDPKRERILFATVHDVTLFDASAGAALARFGTGGKLNVQVACISPDASLACVGTSASIDVWDIAGEHGAPNEVVPHLAQEMPRYAPAHRFEPDDPRNAAQVAARFSPDGAFLAMCTSSLERGTGALRLWSAKEERVVATVNWDDPITNVAFAPDGESMFVALTTARVAFGQRSAGQGRIDVVDLRGNGLGTRTVGPEIHDLRFLPTGALLTIDDKALRLLAPDTGEVLATRARKAAYWVPQIADVCGPEVLTIGPIRVFTVG
jgi:hypothetical protein